MDRSNYCTLHGIERTMERTGLSEKRAVKLVRLALERGIHAEDCKWTADRRYLQSLSSERAEAIAYNSYCFIVNKEDNRLITMYRIPFNDFNVKKTRYNSAKYRKMVDNLEDYQGKCAY